MNSTPVRTCTHIFTSGAKCKAIALRDSPRCYHHHSHRRRLKRAQLRNTLDTRRGRLRAIGQVFDAILDQRVDPEVARSLLYSISVCGHFHPNDR